jgi:predicted O-methyltransferase YrrM
MMPTATQRLARARETARAIEGWLTDAEGEFLFRVAADCPPGAPIVEIGSWKGKSTVFLASGISSPGATRVFAIDPHVQSLEDAHARTLDDLRDNLARAGVTGAVEPVVSQSHAYAPTFVQRPGVVFVDGSHLEEAVQIDLDDWLPKLIDGGVIALHDVINHRWSGPRRALRRLLWRSTQITACQFVDSIAWMKKVPSNTASDRRRNRLVALLLVVYEIKAVPLPPPLPRLIRAAYRLTPLKRQSVQSPNQ